MLHFIDIRRKDYKNITAFKSVQQISFMGVINLSSKDNKLNDQIFNNVINLISHAIYIVRQSCYKDLSPITTRAFLLHASLQTDNLYFRLVK